MVNVVINVVVKGVSAIRQTRKVMFKPPVCTFTERHSYTMGQKQSHWVMQ